jgi:hypothetical protein
MRPLVILTLLGTLALVLGAGFLTQSHAGPEREDPVGPLHSDPIDGPVRVDLQGLAADRATLPDEGQPLRVDLTGPAPVLPGGEFEDPEDPDAWGEPLPLAMLPGRASEHTMSGYSAGSAGSDLPLEEGVELLAFDDLMLPDYVQPAVLDDDEERDGDLFPPEVLAYHGQRVALEGYMQPLEFNGNSVVSFVLSPYPPGCCFGGMPGLDEWVDVRTSDPEGVQYLAYRVIRVTGTLEVGEVLDDWGYVSSLYRMETDKVEKLW